MKKVTIQEVAKELNLSRNTVAKALNNSSTVAYETRYIVIKKAYEMGYSKLLPVVLNEFKIKDRLSEVKTIAVLARRELSTYWNHIIMGISDELNKNNCRLQFHFITNEEEQEGVLPIDIEEELHGILILSVFSDPYIQKIASLEAPMVFLDAPEDIGKVNEYGDIVLFEGENSVRKMTENIIKEGAEKLAFLGDTTYCTSMQECFMGFTHAISEAGQKKEQSYYKVGPMPEHYEKEEEVAMEVESFPALPDAIVCGNATIEESVLSYLKNKKIKVPEEVIVAAVGTDAKRMGRRLVQQLMFRIENPEMPHEVVKVNPELKPHIPGGIC